MKTRTLTLALALATLFQLAAHTAEAQFNAATRQSFIESCLNNLEDRTVQERRAQEVYCSCAYEHIEDEYESMEAFLNDDKGIESLQSGCSREISDLQTISGKVDNGYVPSGHYELEIQQSYFDACAGGFGDLDLDSDVKEVQDYCWCTLEYIMDNYENITYVNDHIDVVEPKAREHCDTELQNLTRRYQGN